MSDFSEELRKLINRHSRENDSNTPDHVLADYVLRCLEAFNDATRDREDWYGCRHWPGMPLRPMTEGSEP